MNFVIDNKKVFSLDTGENFDKKKVREKNNFIDGEFEDIEDENDKKL